ncbi:LysM peptidoglycan-binding domain-containing protein [Paenibacillus thalictri]|uniref:LysM peptidoglycan-binding domain-containing protein n=1 Tax=Paenibacillus thalictri TaxID=2527873 RepID=A0A4Q9DX10_9BACL|nr:LysM peptidoglycan-binding domain-containing protein [Paenibacillus thalictri]TBL81644.1 LysM peptidoglycan-binding domain-containing protein [Paenibacillus thalictri]
MVSEHHHGLRFDIYERVHLPEGILGIKELDEVELVPHIQVMQQGEEAVLRGNLLLNGSYVDEQNTANRTLEHLIPVEITLPLNRVGNVGEITVDIENFDVDLLSTRSLNVTGVLSLNGIDAREAQPDIWQQSEEEVIFIHEAEERLTAAAPQQPAQQQIRAEEPTYSGFFPGMVPGQQEAAEEPKEPEAEAAEEEANMEYELDPEEQEDSLFHVSAAVVEVVPNGANNASPDQQAVYSEEKKEMKIAFGSKGGQEAEEQKVYGLKSLIHAPGSSPSDTNRKQAVPEQAASEAPSADALEWKKVLLSSVSDQQQFRKLRMYIVQKDETLESIAKRYELNPREIAIFNRLTEHQVNVGQVVRIPVK